MTVPTRLTMNRNHAVTGVLAIAGVYAWATQTFGTAVWVLLGALLLRYLLFVGGVEGKNPFNSFLVYIGSLIAGQYTPSGVLPPDVLKAVVLLAAVYEVKAVLADMPAIQAWLQKRAGGNPADVAALQVQMAQITQALGLLTKGLQQGVPTGVTPPAGGDAGGGTGSNPLSGGGSSG